MGAYLEGVNASLQGCSSAGICQLRLPKEAG